MTQWPMSHLALWRPNYPQQTFQNDVLNAIGISLLYIWFLVKYCHFNGVSVFRVKYVNEELAFHSTADLLVSWII